MLKNLNLGEETHFVACATFILVIALCQLGTDAIIAFDLGRVHMVGVLATNVVAWVALAVCAVKAGRQTWKEFFAD